MTVDTNCESLAKLFEADQEDRERFLDGQLDPERIKRRDARRRAAVRSMVAQRRLHTAADYYRAAMILHHGKRIKDFDDAHRLARTAVELTVDDDELHKSAKWLTAATWDRSQMKRGQPQCYGTQFVQETSDSPWKLYEIDESVLSDDERREMNVPSLAETLARLADMNK